MQFSLDIPRVRLSTSELREAGRVIFNAPRLRLDPGDGDLVADHLSQSDIDGYESHGLQRTLRYINAVLDGHLTPSIPPKIAFLRGCNARIEAKHTLGRLGMQLLISKALELGVQHGAANVMTLTYHIGRMAPYLARLAKEGYIVSCQVNAVGSATTSILTRQPRLGTNPLGLAVPNGQGGAFVLDFTPAITTEGNMRVYHAAGSQVPSGLLLDSTGEPTTNPGVIYAKDAPLGSILPLGGGKMHPMAHLLNMIEMSAGALTGNLSARLGAPSPIRGFNAVLLSIVHPDAFGISCIDFNAAIAETADYIRRSPPLDPLYAGDDGKVLLPGEYEAMMAQRAARDGVKLSAATWQELLQAAAKVDVSISHIQPTKL